MLINHIRGNNTVRSKTLLHRHISSLSPQRERYTPAIAQQWKNKCAHHLLQHNYTVGIPNGMDIIIKGMQLSKEKFIDRPQKINQIPAILAIFVDLTNMFTLVSQSEMFTTIAKHFPELHAFTTLLYVEPGEVHYKWKDTTWKSLYIEEGISQGCPLSLIFATLVLHQVSQPLAKQLQQRAKARHDNNKNNNGDERCSSLTHLFAYMDSISSTVAHKDLKLSAQKYKN